MRRQLLIVLFFALRVAFAAGFVWMLHQEGPTMANVTLKMKSRYNCLFAMHGHLVYHAHPLEREQHGQKISGGTPQNS